MFVVNSEDIGAKRIYNCSKKISDILQKNGFAVFSRIDGMDIYIQTKDLSRFIKENGLPIGGDGDGV